MIYPVKGIKYWRTKFGKSSKNHTVSLAHVKPGAIISKG